MIVSYENTNAHAHSANIVATQKFDTELNLPKKQSPHRESTPL
jgi:hypothetical protein